jgi:putative transposase
MDAAKPVHRRADHWRSARAGSRDGGGGGMPQTRQSQPAWKAKFGGMSVSDAKRLKQLEEENARLKKLLAEAMLDNAVLKDITSRKW